ncbi:ROK family protein [Streptomyces sp. NPDC005799]|uniref:ROK family protein n=1 Tax=Streptomyces sp. NPDC005799 TaxID=3154678 RepID=UPI0033F15FCC
MKRPCDVVAIDLGGTAIKAARFDADGVAEETVSLPTPVTKGQNGVIEAVLGVAESLCRPSTKRIGLCAAGLLDISRGHVVLSPNLGLRDVPLVQQLVDRLGVPVELEHDVRAACIAEREFSRHEDCTDFIVVVIGTGIGAGIVSNGQIVRGAQGYAGEFGHVVVRPDGESCPCGQRGCVEVYASAGGMTRRYNREGGNARHAADIASRLPSDPLAAKVWRAGTDALAHAITMSTALLDHQKVVLAGGVTGAGANLLEPVREQVAHGLTWRQSPVIEISSLGGHAGLLGAALIASFGAESR